MQDPDTWIGAWPSNPYWTDEGSHLYFSWNPEGAFPSDSLYRISHANTEPQKVSFLERQKLAPRFSGWEHGRHIYNQDHTRKVYSRDGDLFVYEIDEKKSTRLTQTQGREATPRFTVDGNAVIYLNDDNLFKKDLSSGLTIQLQTSEKGKTPKKPNRLLK
jgi:Tol biopolymer transport system component